MHENCPWSLKLSKLWALAMAARHLPIKKARILADRFPSSVVGLAHKIRRPDLCVKGVKVTGDSHWAID